jgi:hypothetical protein
MGFEYLDCIHMIRVRSSVHGNEPYVPIKCTAFVEQLMAAQSATAPTSPTTGCPAFSIKSLYEPQEFHLRCLD